MLENLFARERVMTDEQVKEKLAELNGDKVRENLIKGLVIADGALLIYKYSAAVDGFIGGIGNSIASSTSTFMTKMARPIVFPYVLTISTGKVYLGILTVVLLTVMFVAVTGKLNGKSNKEVIFECGCILAPPIAWILMGGI